MLESKFAKYLNQNPINIEELVDDGMTAGEAVARFRNKIDSRNAGNIEY